MATLMDNTNDAPQQSDLPTVAINSQAAQEIESMKHLPKVIPFGALCRCGDEVWIENGGQIYRLRRTRQGKLILTK
ncbi:hemin uptake protein HemP [Planctomycetaceae bacterium SH139]